MTISVVGLFCDDIREEKTEQLTLVGIFADNMRVPKVPGGLAKLGFYVRILFDPSEPPPPAPIVVRLLFPDVETAVLGEFTESDILPAREQALERGSPIVGLIMHGIIAPFRVINYGRLRAEVQIGTETFLACILNFVPRDSKD